LHLPQFFGSSVVGVSQPFDASPSHSAVPGAQGPSPQMPFQQAPPGSQALPQPPQLAASVSGFLQLLSQQSQAYGQSAFVAQPGVQTPSAH
jgi:hypothetical protein